MVVNYKSNWGDDDHNKGDWEVWRAETAFFSIKSIRRSLSFEFVLAQALCLLSRLTYLGEGAREAARRREQMVREEECRRLQRLAHHEAHIRGRGVSRVGEVFTLP